MPTWSLYAKCCSALTVVVFELCVVQADFVPKHPSRHQDGSPHPTVTAPRSIGPVGSTIWPYRPTDIDLPGLPVVVASNPDAAKGSNGKNDSVPKTLEEGLIRLQQILGSYDADNQLEWNFASTVEYRNKPTPTGAQVLMVIKSSMTVGHPFEQSHMLGFDEVSQWRRQVFDVDETGKQTPTRTQVSHSVNRWILSLKSGVWQIAGFPLSNGVHDYLGAEVTGTVVWHSDRVEFRVIQPLDRYYGPNGTYILGMSHGSVTFRREGGRLHKHIHTQTYHLANDPEGYLMTVPDFKRPFGTPFEQDYVSEPLFDMKSPGGATTSDAR